MKVNISRLQTPHRHHMLKVISHPTSDLHSSKTNKTTTSTRQTAAAKRMIACPRPWSKSTSKCARWWHRSSAKKRNEPGKMPYFWNPCHSFKPHLSRRLRRCLRKREARSRSRSSRTTRSQWWRPCAARSKLVVWKRTLIVSCEWPRNCWIRTTLRSRRLIIASRKDCCNWISNLRKRCFSNNDSRWCCETLNSQSSAQRREPLADVARKR